VSSWKGGLGAALLLSLLATSTAAQQIPSVMGVVRDTAGTPPCTESGAL
jgi:hypothetical protein